MKIVNLFILTLVSLFACASGTPPKRGFEVHLWNIDGLENICLERLNDDDQLIRTCPGDDDFPLDVVSITIKDYNKERAYQKELMLSCKEWK